MHWLYEHSEHVAPYLALVCSIYGSIVSLNTIRRRRAGLPPASLPLVRGVGIVLIAVCMFVLGVVAVRVSNGS